MRRVPWMVAAGVVLVVLGGELPADAAGGGTPDPVSVEVQHGLQAYGEFTDDPAASGGPVESGEFTTWVVNVGRSTITEDGVPRSSNGFVVQRLTDAREVTPDGIVGHGVSTFLATGELADDDPSFVIDDRLESAQFDRVVTGRDCIYGGPCSDPYSIHVHATWIADPVHATPIGHSQPHLWPDARASVVVLHASKRQAATATLTRDDGPVQVSAPQTGVLIDLNVRNMCVGDGCF